MGAESKIARRKSNAWADLPASEIETLISNSRRQGWREALAGVEKRAAFFAKRMRNLSIANWHLLLGLSNSGIALDVGAGFGSNVLGLAAYYQTAIGIDFLPDRLRYASLRAAQSQRLNCQMARADGHALPFGAGSFSLVTMNGVLEWAALYDDERAPRASQVAMLEEARRVLVPGGSLAFAIENRYALESLLALPDTHTGLQFVTAMPRALADLYARIRTGEAYRTYLYDRPGYQRLIREAGFESLVIFDLVASYNDYDFVLDPADTASYRLLYGSGWVRHFYEPAGRMRDWLGKFQPGLLGGLAYAYLVIGGKSVTTALDPSHEVWKAAGRFGIEPGPHRFACQGAGVGSLAVVSHDGQAPRALLELGVRSANEPLGGSILPGALGRRWVSAFRHVGSTIVNGALLHAHVARA